MNRIKCFMVEICEGGFRNLETGEVLVAPLPPGAMWYASESYSEGVGNPGPDGRHLYVMTPGGMWGIDGSAANCTRPTERKQHHCWVRHGEPPNVTIDKNGETCGCGCSIGVPYPDMKYHGFLRNGYLEEC